MIMKHDISLIRFTKLPKGYYYCEPLPGDDIPVGYRLATNTLMACAKRKNVHYILVKEKQSCLHRKSFLSFFVLFVSVFLSVLFLSNNTSAIQLSESSFTYGGVFHWSNETYNSYNPSFNGSLSCQPTDSGLDGLSYNSSLTPSDSRLYGMRFCLLKDSNYDNLPDLDLYYIYFDYEFSGVSPSGISPSSFSPSTPDNSSYYLYHSGECLNGVCSGRLVYGVPRDMIFNNFQTSQLALGYGAVYDDENGWQDVFLFDNFNFNTFNYKLSSDGKYYSSLRDIYSGASDEDSILFSGTVTVNFTNDTSISRNFTHDGSKYGAAFTYSDFFPDDSSTLYIKDISVVLNASNLSSKRYTTIPFIWGLVSIDPNISLPEYSDAYLGNYTLTATGASITYQGSKCQDSTDPEGTNYDYCTGNFDLSIENASYNNRWILTPAKNMPFSEYSSYSLGFSIQNLYTGDILPTSSISDQLFNQYLTEENYKKEAGDLFSQLGSVFNFTFFNPFANWFFMFTDSNSCVNIPVIASMLHLPSDTQYCPWFSSDIRNILTPVLTVFGTLIIFGYLVDWLNSGQSDGSITLKKGHLQ